MNTIIRLLYSDTIMSGGVVYATLLACACIAIAGLWLIRRQDTPPAKQGGGIAWLDRQMGGGK